MSAKPETTLYQRVHKHLPPLSELHREKMANPYRAGGADFWYSGKKRDLWVEWKHVVLPKRNDTLVRLGLTPLQLAWLGGRHDEGRHVGVFVGCAKGVVTLFERLWERDLPQGQFVALLRPHAQVAGWIRDFTLGNA